MRTQREARAEAKSIDWSPDTPPTYCRAFRREAGPVSPVIAGRPWLGEPRDAGAHLALSPAERAAVAAELARLSARVATLAAQLDRLHTVLV